MGLPISFKETILHGICLSSVEESIAYSFYHYGWHAEERDRSDAVIDLSDPRTADAVARWVGGKRSRVKDSCPRLRLYGDGVVAVFGLALPVMLTIPEAADLDPDDDRLLVDGAPWVVRAGWAAVARHVGRAP